MRTSPLRHGLSAPAVTLILWTVMICVTSFVPRSQAQTGRGALVVFLAGKKSHAPGHHEYERGLRLLARSLATSPGGEKIQAEVVTDGWPEDVSILDRADTIVLFSDGANKNPANHPFLTGDRLQVIDRQMRRGAGLVVIHYGIFVGSVHGAPQFMDWVGGHFDYESGAPPTHYASRLRTAQAIATPVGGAHPVLRGVHPFPLHDEYYVNMKFQPADPRVRPILTVELPGETEPQVVSWATQRRDGGRGFVFTGGHFHENWEVTPLRRLILNAIAWTAHAPVPTAGLESRLTREMLADLDPDSLPLRVRVVTGDSHPAHDWKAVTAALREMLVADRRVEVTVEENPENLATLDPRSTDVVLLNYKNWNRGSLSPAAADRLLAAVRGGMGVLVLHHANAAWPDWTDYPRLSRRVWVEGRSGHDPGGRFRLDIIRPDHPITRDLPAWETTDELYFRQEGLLPATPLIAARSAVTGQQEPLAFVANEGNGRVFQCLLGHDAAAVRNEGTSELLRRGVAWLAGREPRTLVPRAGSPRPASSRQPTLGPIPGAPPAPPVRLRSLDWPVVQGEPGGSRYSDLDQVHRGNVRRLAEAWTYRTGDADPGSTSTIECTPIVVDGVMYLTTVKLRVVALDAATGKEIWSFDPRGRGVNRGVAYWSDGNPEGKRRILMGTEDGRLFSLDARDGRLDPRFGVGGMVDLRAGMGPNGTRLADSMSYGITSAPAVFEDLVVLPLRTAERQPGAAGDVRALDIRTGREVWRFRTVPRPGEAGNETWQGDGWKDRSGANPWSGFTVDRERGMIFCGTGSATSDFYGGDRPGNNLFANCTLALDARTGKRIWHFQTVRHDLWDHDNPCPPVLARVRHDGKLIDAAAQVTKLGFVYVFDRETGRPLFPIEERPVPGSDVPGEWTARTQPFPVKPPPFCPQSVGWDDLTNISPEANAFARSLFATLRGGPNFTPPSLQGTVVIPGLRGGSTWSGASVDPDGILYVNSNNIPNIIALTKTATGYEMGRYRQFLDADGLPAVKPPWGTVNAIDLNRGEILWQVPLGEEPKLAGKGYPPTGSENFGGTIVTAGGLVLIGGGKDEKLHAYDRRNGKLLWEWKLPAGGYATPCTYMVRGRQYIVIAAGGGGKPATRSGDAFVAFALPEDAPEVADSRTARRR